MTTARMGRSPAPLEVAGTLAGMGLSPAQAVRSWSKGQQQREPQLVLKRCQCRDAGSLSGASPLSRHLKIISRTGRHICAARCWQPCHRCQGEEGKCCKQGPSSPTSSHPPLPLQPGCGNAQQGTDSQSPSPSSPSSFPSLGSVWTSWWGRPSASLWVKQWLKLLPC